MKPTLQICILLGAAFGASGCVAAEAETGTKTIAGATELQCSEARRTLAQAVENYSLLEGKPPRNETALVPGYLLMTSPLMDLDATGNVVAAPNSGCR